MNKKKRKKTRPDTGPIPVANGWAGAVMRFFSLFDSITMTNGRTDKASYRVTSTIYLYNPLHLTVETLRDV